MTARPVDLCHPRLSLHPTSRAGTATVKPSSSSLLRMQPWRSSEKVWLPLPPLVLPPQVFKSGGD